MEGWFAADAETISLKCWDKVHPILLDSFLIVFSFFRGGGWGEGSVRLKVGCLDYFKLYSFVDHALCSSLAAKMQ